MRRHQRLCRRPREVAVARAGVRAAGRKPAEGAGGRNGVPYRRGPRPWRPFPGACRRKRRERPPSARSADRRRNRAASMSSPSTSRGARPRMSRPPAGRKPSGLLSDVQRKAALTEPVRQLAPPRLRRSPPTILLNPPATAAAEPPKARLQRLSRSMPRRSGGDARDNEPNDAPRTGNRKPCRQGFRSPFFSVSLGGRSGFRISVILTALPTLPVLSRWIPTVCPLTPSPARLRPALSPVQFLAGE